MFTTVEVVAAFFLGALFWLAVGENFVLPMVDHVVRTLTWFGKDRR